MAQTAQGPRTSRTVRIAILLLIAAALVCLDNLTGPFIPFTVFYIALLYFTMTRVGSTWSYLIALISAAGHTYCVTHGLLHREQLGFVAWQFATSFSELSLLCVLLDRRRYARPAQVAAGPEPEAPARPATEQPDRRAALFTKNTDRYTPVFILLSVAFLAAFVPWIHDSSTLASYCPSYGEETSLANAGATGSQAVVTRTKPLLLAVDGSAADFEADRVILDDLDRHLAKSIWLVDCSRYDPSIDAHAARNLQTLQRLVKDGHVIAVRGRGALEVAPEPDEDGLRNDAVQCSEAFRDKAGVQPLEFGALFGAFPDQANASLGAPGFAMPREVDFDRALEFQAGAGNPAAPEVVMDRLLSSLRSNDIVVIHDSLRSARHLDAFMSLAEQNGYSFAVPDRRGDVPPIAEHVP